jgi:hypothetical protein
LHLLSFQATAPFPPSLQISYYVLTSKLLNMYLISDSCSRAQLTNK